MIAVVNTGVGNLRSVLLALNRACPEVSVRIASERKTLNDASKVVFPGQGSMRDCIERLNSLDMVDELRRCLVKKPFLGICLGKQILFDYSEEGGSQGLGFLPGKVKRFKKKNAVKILTKGSNPLLAAFFISTKFFISNIVNLQPRFLLFFQLKSHHHMDYEPYSFFDIHLDW